MAAAGEVLLDDGADVLRALRTATGRQHEQVEAALDLLHADLSRERLVAVLAVLCGFGRAAEAGLDDWAAREPADAAALDWPRRRRAALYAADLDTLGAADAAPRGPDLPRPAGTDEALGRLYVLEGSTLGGTFIDRHLATLPHLVRGGRLRAFTPYGEDTGSMWHTFRRFTRAHVADGGDAGRVVASAGATFRALADRCAPVARPATPG